MIPMNTIYNEMGIRETVLSFGKNIEKNLKDRFEKIDEIAEYNQLKVIKAMQDNRVSAECFNTTSGYGYNDLGRDTLEKVYASCFGGEDALVRPQITCGTHALALALMSNLRPGDELLSPVGKPYDTLEEVIGIRPSKGSLAEYGITYRQVDLLADGEFDYEGIRAAINERTHLVTIQRSKGYAPRKTLSVERIGKLIAFIKDIKPDVICMVDNCYGEFVETSEPVEVGCDLMIGSMIKNVGGGIARTGGYIAGKEALVQQCAERLTCIGMGKEVGCSLDMNRELYLGFFHAPDTTANALKTADFAAALFGSFGFSCHPPVGTTRGDIVEAICLGDEAHLTAFCQGIQQGSPVDSFVVPEAWDMPGYTSKVIIAAGAFTMGASIELSADAPIREPFAVWMQGGMTYTSGKIGVLLAAQKMLDQGLISL